MASSIETLAQFKKATKLTRLTLRAHGPKSYKRGQGALLVALNNKDEQTQKDLCVALGCCRSELKNIVKKAKRNGLVEIKDANEKKTYLVALTEEGKEVAQKRAQAQEKEAEKILSVLTEDERAALDSISEKLIVAAHDAGISAKRKGHKPHCHHRGHGRKHHGARMYARC